MKLRKYSFTLAAISVLGVILTVVASQDREPVKERISVNGARPLALATEMLAQKYRWLVTYEDPAYVYEGDLVDVTAIVRKDFAQYEPGKAPKVLSPKGGELTFSYEIDPTTKRPTDAALVIQQMLDAYSISNPGIFQLEREGRYLHIVPIAVRNDSGALTPQRSVLDAEVSFPAQKRDASELLTVLCAAIRKTTRNKIVVAHIPINSVYRYQTETGATNIKARDLLSNELERMSKNKLSWRLLYESTSKTYYLNIHVVSNVVAANGKTLTRSNSSLSSPPSSQTIAGPPSKI